MIFFRGPIVYINPTRIPDRCPAKEVLENKKSCEQWKGRLFLVGIQNGECRTSCKDKASETPRRKSLSETKHRDIICLQGYKNKFSFFVTTLKLGFTKLQKSILKIS